MSKSARNCLAIVAASSLLIGAALVFAETKTAHNRTPNGTVDREKILGYIRDRFGLPEAVKMTFGPLQSSPDRKFEQATVAIDDGKQKKDQNILVSKDGRFLIVGTAFALNSEENSEVARFIREQFKIPANLQVTVGTPKNSAFPDFYETTVTVGEGANKQSQNFYLSKESHALIWGNIFSLAIDPKRDALHTIVTQRQPAVGPAGAPVTIVEYADLECPTCARLHEFVENDLLPKYGDKVRVVFKEFPLASHDWAMTAAVASQCAYEQNPETFAAYRSSIFKNQSSINATNARDMLLNLAAQAGIDSLKLAGCVDSKASLPRVEQNVNEGKRLGIDRTPTSFVNGKTVVGLPAPETFYQLVDEALSAHKAKRS